jgi:flagellar basal-body rod protein FlgC
MGLFSILDMSSAGMDVQQARLAAATANIANARTTRAADGEVYRPLQVVVSSEPGTALTNATGAMAPTALPMPVVSTVTAVEVAPRLVYEPGHPDADEKGFVRLPGVDPITSMMDLISISRGYEANVRAFDVTRTLLQRTLDLWRNR